jgi:hypothetical protein
MNSRRCTHAHEVRPRKDRRGVDLISATDAQRTPLTRLDHVYEVRPRKDKRGVNLISDALPFGRLWYGGPHVVGNAIGHAKHRSRSHRVVIRVYDDAGNVIETHEHAGEFTEW